jgi:hypothetical protein
MVTKWSRTRQDRASHAAREALEGPAAPDRVVTADAAGMPACDLVIVASRRKPGWERGAAVITPDTCFRIGEPQEKTIAGRLRYLYPLTEHTDFEAIRRSVHYELPAARPARAPDVT